MCGCASISPGRSVIPGSSIVVVPGGTVTSVAGPAAAILSPVTRTTQPSCVVALTPSNTRCGRRSTLFSVATTDDVTRSTKTNHENRARMDEPPVDILSHRANGSKGEGGCGTNFSEAARDVASSNQDVFDAARRPR